jgi:hypothetical protein
MIWPKRGQRFRPMYHSDKHANGQTQMRRTKVTPGVTASSSSPVVQTAGTANWRDSVSDLCSLGELIETKIGHEIALMGHRMEWLVVAEAFLFGAFATVLAATSIDPFAKYFMLFLLPVLGISITVFAAISLRAALAVSRALVIARGVIDKELKHATGMKELPNLGLESREPSLLWTENHGRVTVWCVPPTIFAAWVVILIFVVPKAGGYLSTQPPAPSPRAKTAAAAPVASSAVAPHTPAKSPPAETQAR